MWPGGSVEPPSLTQIKQRAAEHGYDDGTSTSGCAMSDIGNSASGTAPWRMERGAVSAVRMSEQLTAAVDAWAEAHEMTRSDAIRTLVEFGLESAAVASVSHPTIAVDSTKIEEVAVELIDRMLDPSLPHEERERRIRRLTEGPPEFSDERIDLPKRRT